MNCGMGRSANRLSLPSSRFGSDRQQLSLNCGKSWLRRQSHSRAVGDRGCSSYWAVMIDVIVGMRRLAEDVEVGPARLGKLLIFKADRLTPARTDQQSCWRLPVRRTQAKLDQWAAPFERARQTSAGALSLMQGAFPAAGSSGTLHDTTSLSTYQE